MLTNSNPTLIASDSTQLASRRELYRRTVWPLGVYALYGLAAQGDRLLAVDASRGYLVQIDPLTDNTTILNIHNVEDFLGATGLSVDSERIWFTKENQVYWCQPTDLTPQLFISLPYPADGVAVWKSTVYVTCQKAGYIFIFDRATGNQITKLSAPGVGIENLTVRDEELWICDQTEQTVYCMDRATGEISLSILTPFAYPTGLSFFTHPETGEILLYIAYTQEEPYIRDDPNSETPEKPYELTFRDRTFIHPLHFRYNPERHCTLSNGYLIEMSYAEEISILDEVEEIEELEWCIALPADTPRQTLKHIEPIGMPFTERVENGQRIAVFKFDKLTPHQGGLFGWKALLEVRGIKYFLTPRQLENLPPLPLEFQRQYLIDDDELAMDNPLITAAAKEAIGTETNLLRKILKIRNYVYDRLSYAIKPRIDTPDVVLERGTGSCGEYVGLLLALARLNGIACRTVGRYKCPPRAEQQQIPLEPDFNHVWIEFYVPGFGWLPMESNVDDVIEGGPYPTRFFMGLPWYHIEMSKDATFERLQTPNRSVDVSIGELAINHVRFTILTELPPPT
jgi:transglutaminase-like putative cysteine protease